MDKVEVFLDKFDKTIIDSWVESINERFRECIKYKGKRINYLIDIWF